LKRVQVNAAFDSGDPAEACHYRTSPSPVTRRSHRRVVVLNLEALCETVCRYPKLILVRSPCHLGLRVCLTSLKPSHVPGSSSSQIKLFALSKGVRVHIEEVRSVTPEEPKWSAQNIIVFSWPKWTVTTTFFVASLFHCRR